MENFSELSVTSVSYGKATEQSESVIGAQIPAGSAATEISVIEGGDCTETACDEEQMENSGTLADMLETGKEISLLTGGVPGTDFTAETYSGADTVKAGDIIRTAADSALSKLSEIMSSFGEHSASRFEIQLEPENLGSLSISLSMSSNGLKALIRTKDSQVQSLLASEINSLLDKLGENNVQIKSIDVICTGSGGDELLNQNSGNTHSGRNSHAYRGNYAETVQTAYEEKTQYYAWVNEDVLGSTVVYRA